MINKLFYTVGQIVVLGGGSILLLLLGLITIKFLWLHCFKFLWYSIKHLFPWWQLSVKHVKGDLKKINAIKENGSDEFLKKLVITQRGRLIIYTHPDRQFPLKKQFALLKKE